MSTAHEKLKKITSQESSKWIEKTRWRIQNENWLDKSAKIALKILRTLREKKLNQADLAKELSITPQQISKIVKGHENLTLETISKIEVVLGVTLIDTSFSNTSVESYLDNNFVLPSYKNNETLTSKELRYDEMLKPINCPIYELRKSA